MTAPSVKAPDTRPIYARPRVLIPLAIATMLAVGLLTPEPNAGRTGDPRLTTYSTNPMGARLFHDLVNKLGWRVARRDSAALHADERTIHAVLAATRPLRGAEVHELLEHVRKGGALFVVLADGNDGIADSLRVRHQSSGARPLLAPDDTAGCADHPPPRFEGLWPGHLSAIYRLQWRRQPPDSLEVFLRVANATAAVVITAETDSAERRPAGGTPAMVGFPFGRGRIVVGSDPDLVRNDALRVCQIGLDVPVIRALEYLREGGAQPRDLFVVDEFHHGFGSQPGTLTVIANYLGATPSGRLFAQLVAAGLLLLLALSPRLVAPREPGRVERRSPLEHVDALARAYERVSATRTVTARLLRGLRRRVHRTSPAGSSETNDAFLARVESATPSLAPAVELIRRALATPVSRRELGDVGTALQDVESSLTRMSQ